MVYLRSGRRTTGDARLVPCLDFEPTAPDGGFLVFYPIRVGRYVLPDDEKQRYSHIAIIGHMVSAIGNGMDVLSALDDAALNVDGHFDFHHIISKEDCQCYPHDPFRLEKIFLQGGMKWQRDIEEGELFIAVQQGKVSSFGWHKKGNSRWHVYEPPCFESIPC